ncbi:MAG: type II TA system antitoxin MqsA family protein [Senegalia sp. (in: firmicutes)]|uniref:type II TA system antitoxin MqsA family protein n=1 Tax=Senegalia sp. (in: firmicutes) TaxID=1924098 RepID=UPI003F9E7297
MKGFCEKCRDMVDFSIKMENKNKIIKGKKIEYIAKVAYCCECNEEIFVHDIRDYNLKEIDNEYRRSEHLITVYEIEQILNKYNIGKRPISMLLGWGEGTVTRYVDGDIPSKTYSDILKRILEDKQHYKDILEENKENISDLAYRKSIASIESKKNSESVKTDKFESAIKYILMHSSEITPLALQKLLYFAQGFKKAFTNEYMFDEDCEAWVHGPVYRNIYERYSSYGCKPIEEDLCFNNSNLEKNEKELLDYIIHYFGCYSGKVLENMTHAEEPWRVTRRGLKNSESSDRAIDKKIIEEYFNDVKEKYKMLNFTDIKDYSTDLFNKLCL